MAASPPRNGYAPRPPSWQPYPAPGLDFAVLLGGGVLAALAITTVALPLMQVMTRYDAIRHE